MGRRAAPIGTISEHRIDGAPYRRIKVLDKQGRPTWRFYSHHLWEIHHGPIPSGYRVLHEDGDTLNDDPANLTLGTAADTLFLALEVRRVERRRLRNLAKAQRRRASEMAQIRHAFRVLANRWYIVVHARRFILLQPFVTQQAALAEFELPTGRREFKPYRTRGVDAVPGRDLPTTGYARVSRVDVEAAIAEIRESLVPLPAWAS